MHCCQAWEPVGKCFDQNSFECIDFHGLSQIIASLARERITEREAEIGDLPWTQTTPWRSKKPMLCLHASTDEEGHPLENEDDSGRMFQARIEGERHHCHENILRYVQKALDDICWEIDRNEFDELMAAKKESAPGPDVTIFAKIITVLTRYRPIVLELI